MRKSISTLSFFCLCVFLSAHLSTQISAEESLNVLMIVADDLRTQLGCYGDPSVQTPHLDSLAKRGLLFERAYCQQAVCNPSRASMLTGLRPDTIKVWDLRTNFRTEKPKAITLPQHFKQHGYHTQGIGKIFHNMGNLNDEPSWSVAAKYHTGRHSDDYQQQKNRSSQKKGPSFEDQIQNDNTYLDGKITTEVIKTLRQLRQEHQKFFLAVGYWRPHLPFLAPQQYWKRYQKEHIKLPELLAPPHNVPEIALHDSRELRGYSDIPRVGSISRAKMKMLHHGYRASISYLDEQIGHVIAELDRLQLSEKTIIVFCSDHGFHLGEHGLWCKTSNFELDARVPLLVVTPSSFEQHCRNTKTTALVELVDLYPTLVELCELPVPPNLEGISFLPVLEQPARKWKSAAFTQHPRPAYYREKPEVMGYSLRSERFRYTEWKDWTSGKVLATELYDHQNDAIETNNLAASSTYTGRVKEFSRALQEGWKQAVPSSIRKSTETRKAIEQ